MSKRTTVKVDIERIEIIIKANGWRNSYFAEVIMKKQRGWVSEWKRDKNFPSPEEAARMCILLKTTPDDILLHEGKNPEETAKCLEDIETVRKLVEAEGIKKAPDPKIEGLSADELRNLVQKTNDRDVLLMVLDEVNKKLQELR